MDTQYSYDASVIGSGPNGLAAAITLAQAGLSVIVYEAKDSVGGGLRSAELTLPGFIHDICSAVHPLGVGSPFFQSLQLEKQGLEWIYPSAAMGHPFDDGHAALLENSIADTGKTLDPDSRAYDDLMKPIAMNWEDIGSDLLGPLRIPQHPLQMAKFAALAVQSAAGLAKRKFKGDYAQAFFGGLAAHSIMELDKPLTAAFGLILGVLGHVFGWPIPKGGSQKIADVLASIFQRHGGKIVTGMNIENIDDLPPSKLIMCDVTPRQLLKIAGHHFSGYYRSQLQNYRYGPGVFKIDWALNNPIPWKNNECRRACTIHIGGTMPEIINSEREVWENKHPEKPFVLLAQPSLFDPTRAPAGKHTAWAYCHVPNGSIVDMTARIEAQIERFAPGFSDCIIAKSTQNCVEMERYNANYVGGDINGGVQDMFQLFTRPAIRLVPYSTPVKGLYLCSSSTPPGGGVHGMCGYHAARAALSYLDKTITPTPFRAGG